MFQSAKSSRYQMFRNLVLKQNFICFEKRIWLTTEVYHLLYLDIFFLLMFAVTFLHLFWYHVSEMFVQKFSLYWEECLYVFVDNGRANFLIAKEYGKNFHRIQSFTTKRECSLKDYIRKHTKNNSYLWKPIRYYLYI